MMPRESMNTPLAEIELKEPEVFVVQMMFTTALRTMSVTACTEEVVAAVVLGGGAGATGVEGGTGVAGFVCGVGAVGIGRGGSGAGCGVGVVALPPVGCTSVTEGVDGCGVVTVVVFAIVPASVASMMPTTMAIIALAMSDTKESIPCCLLKNAYSC